MTQRFRTTRWSVVLDAAGSDHERRRSALATLCETYWYPLYAYARRRGSSREEAEDLVQGFVTGLLEGDLLSAADPDRGRFRGFLAAAFRHHVSRVHTRERAVKRGGDIPHLSLDFDAGEARFRDEPADERFTPERLFEHRWATALLDQVRDSLRAQWTGNGREAAFAELGLLLGGHDPAPTQREVAERLGMTVGAVKVALHRLRRSYGEKLREAVRETVAEEQDVEDEIRRLAAALRA